VSFSLQSEFQATPNQYYLNFPLKRRGATEKSQLLVIGITIDVIKSEYFVSEPINCDQVDKRNKWPSGTHQNPQRRSIE
jgi:hypothetical protein